MPGIKLSSRLSTIASFIEPCDVFTDIGTDHALLPLWLITRGICKQAVAADINAGPLDKAKQNAASFGITDERIQFVLSDGLNSIEDPPPGKNTLAICGMGGLLISDILQKAGNKAAVYDTFILSPHTKQYELRCFLIENGFDINDEKYVCDDNRLYTIIRAKHALSDAYSIEYTGTDLRFGRFISRALEDTGVKEMITNEYNALAVMLEENHRLPEKRRQALLKEASSYREVLGI